jgi:hypothetical protein
MARVSRILFALCWGLGFLSLVLAVVLRLVPHWVARLSTTPRGGLIFAATLFLCALATREMGQMASPPS